MTKRIVLTCWGSHGDLFPYIGLALALKARGHRPIVATLAIYKETRELDEFLAAPRAGSITRAWPRLACSACAPCS